MLNVARRLSPFVASALLVAWGTSMDGEAKSNPPEGAAPCGAAGYFDQAHFNSDRVFLKMAATASWSFSPHDVPPASAVLMNDPLNLNVHISASNDPWTTSGGSNVWPTALNNVQFSSNMTPGSDTLTPRGANALQFSSAGFNGPTNVLSATVGADGLSISCGTPSSAIVHAMTLELVGPGTIAIMVRSIGYNSQTFTNSTSISIPAGQTRFVGIIKNKILRVDVWNTANGSEGIGSIGVYRRATPDCFDGNGVVGVPDLLAVISQWGMMGTPCDIGGDGISVNDLLAIISNWGPYTGGKCLGENPAGGTICAIHDECFPGFCDLQTCTPSACFCDDSNIWHCTTDCCGRCTAAR
jgi:hypothetical protein